MRFVAKGGLTERGTSFCSLKRSGRAWSAGSNRIGVSPAPFTRSRRKIHDDGDDDDDDDYDHDHDHVAGVRLRPTTCLLFIPQVIYEHSEPWRNDLDKGNS
jgi:hypothetical protein